MDSNTSANRKSSRRGTRVNPLGAFVSLALGLVLTVLCMAYAVGVHVTDADEFQSATDTALVQTGILSQEHAARFAQETIGYLTGRRAAWLTEIAVGDQTVAVPQAFTEHMAQVRQWVILVPYIIPLIIGTVIVLVFVTLIGAMVLRSRMFSAHGYLLGVLIPLLLAGVCFGWAALDFEGFWKVLHDWLIPGGIFALGEPVMELFPLTLFAQYTGPVALTFAYMLAFVLLVALVLKIVDKRVRKRRTARQTQS
ncbi:MAG TPA: DUF1461 domain-containing protein [Candidatus Limiplasma sp.]|nr:DUF1461 domain-containing protein [Candidatus Limiplasma sp.]